VSAKQFIFYTCNDLYNYRFPLVDQKNQIFPNR